VPAVLACGCASGGNVAPGFRIFYPDVPADGFHAKVGKRFYAKPVAECRYDTGHDARWTMTGAHVETGHLPPGVTIEDGALAGIPAEAGSFTARIAFSGNACAGKPVEDQGIDVTIVVKK
jgi:hypothetical protein